MANKTKGMKIGILTAGGDCPGINAAIRSVGKTAIAEYGMRVFGIGSGFRGLIDKEIIELEEERLSGILTLGGTILGTSREKPFKDDATKESASKQIIKNYKEMGLDALVIIGGNGTMKTASKLADAGLSIVGIPKTIDNDVWGTDVSFGFDSAVWIAAEAIDRLHTTANSHKRIMVIEVMGHRAGWISLYSGMAAGGDVILIPEIPFDPDVIALAILKRNRNKKPYSIVVVAEGIDKPKDAAAGTYIARSIFEKTGLETRETILGYVQRGGTPSPMDRILATRYGSYAVDLIVKQKFGNMVKIANNQLGSIPLAEVAGRLKLVPPDHDLIIEARQMGISFGNKEGI